jgi:LAO/AO transport system kinase
MKDVSKQQLQQEIQALIQEKTFNLYRYIGGKS